MKSFWLYKKTDFDIKSNKISNRVTKVISNKTTQVEAQRN